MLVYTLERAHARTHAHTEWTSKQYYSIFTSQFSLLTLQWHWQSHGDHWILTALGCDDWREGACWPVCLTQVKCHRLDLLAELALYTCVTNWPASTLSLCQYVCVCERERVYTWVCLCAFIIYYMCAHILLTSMVIQFVDKMKNDWNRFGLYCEV